MCRPDLTIEERKDSLGGVTGFGTVHECQSWEQLVQWVKQWENEGIEDSSQLRHGRSSNRPQT